MNAFCTLCNSVILMNFEENVDYVKFTYYLLINRFCFRLLIAHLT